MIGRVFSKLYEWFEEFDTFCMALHIILILFGVGLFFIIMAVYHDNAINISFNTFVIVLLAISFPVLSWLVVGMLYVLDRVTAIGVGYITDGDIDLNNFIIGRLFNDVFLIEDIMIKLVILWLVLYSGILLYVYTVLIWFVLILLVIAGMMKLARLAYRTSKKLNQHINDSKAHRG